MNPDDDNTARDLIESAFSETITRLRTPQDFAQMIVTGLRDDPTQRAYLVDAAPRALLYALRVHPLGQLSTETRPHHCGALGLEILGQCDANTPELLHHLANPQQLYGFALGVHAQPDDQTHPAVLLLAATIDGLQLTALAIENDDKEAAGWLIENGKRLDDDDPLPPDLAATLDALTAAVHRTGPQ